MEFSVKTEKKQEITDITTQVHDLVAESGVKEGMCHLFALHTTCAIIINENWDPNICLDLLDALNKSYPDDGGYRHDKVDGNGGAHIKAAILGPSETVPIKNGKLVLGQWQAIMLAEFDGPRERTVRVTVVE